MIVVQTVTTCKNNNNKYAFIYVHPGDIPGGVSWFAGIQIVFSDSELECNPACHAGISVTWIVVLDTFMQL